MSVISIFSTKLNENPFLFGEHGSAISEKNEKLTKVILSTFQSDFDKKAIRTIWHGLSPKDKKEAISRWMKALEPDEDTIPEPDEDAIDAVEEDDDSVSSIWEWGKEYLLNKSNAQGFWSVYPAINHDGVYAIQCLQLGKDRTVRNWTECLVKIAKALDDQATIINLVLHDKDFGITKEHHVYRLEELYDAYGNETAFNNFLEKMGIKELNVVIFQHDTKAIVYKELLNNEHLKDVHEEIKNILEKAKKRYAEAQNKGLDPNNVDTEFYSKLEKTKKGLTQKDPIGNSYINKT